MAIITQRAIALAMEEAEALIGSIEALCKRLDPQSTEPKGFRDHDLDLRWPSNSERICQHAASYLDTLALPSKRQLEVIEQAQRARPYYSFWNILIGRIYEREGFIDTAKEYFAKSVGRNQKDLYAQEQILRQSKHDEQERNRLNDYFCRIPFEYMHINSKRKAYTCCPSWLPYSIGDINEAQDLENCWNSDEANALRDSIIDGSFKHCSKFNCPLISGKDIHLPKRESCQEIIDRGAAKPRVLKLADDKTCNLACPSCRKKFITASKEERTRLNDVFKSMMPILDEVEIIQLAGDGDPFASEYYRNIIRYLTFNRKPGTCRIDLHTNGNLLTPSMWSRLRLEGFTTRIYVSIDAATEKTYRQVRRGGNWSKLSRNLLFMSELIDRGIIKSLTIGMVIQEINFEEMIDFIRLGKRCNCTRIDFKPLRNWATFTEPEFLNHCISLPSHPRHSEYLEILSNPAFKDPIVKGSLFKQNYIA